jgi:hypothetical protein
MIKFREKLDLKISIKFNDTIIAWLENDDIYLSQITQSNHLQSIKKINVDTISSQDVIRLDLTSKKQYVTQWAHEAYLTSICQLEASYDLFVVTQSIDHFFNDIETLNKQIIRQIENHIKEFKFVKLNSKKLQLIVFTDSFFVNNRDMFFQIDYVICFIEFDSRFKMNVIYWSSIKCKRIIRNILVAKLYAIIYASKWFDSIRFLSLCNRIDVDLISYRIDFESI